ncbi:MAG: HAD family hydrolase [Acaryochloridaceae cyanobacterium SU_2_1]|nr:HAD family hydrolase [Acaryochloridaceae cyanobacterium SU_2_1]
MSFDWIFFDCFNTLIDDFDQTGEELALLPVYALPAQAGFYASATEFRQDYHRWRNAQWQTDYREILMVDRYRAVLRARSPSTEPEIITQLALEMLHCFRQCYQQSLRLPPGVQEMLEYWQGRAQMGIVSNFYIEAWPAELLAQFGLESYFKFVLDSSACGWRKPGQEIYQLACQQAQVPEAERSRILFVGDHLENDVISPQSFGMQALYYDRSRERPTSSPAPDSILSISHWQQFRCELWQGSNSEMVH